MRYNALYCNALHPKAVCLILKTLFEQSFYFLDDTILVTTTVNQVQQLLYSTAGANVSISPLIRKLMIGFIMKNGGSFRFEAATLNKANSQSLLLYFSQYAAEKYGPSDYADTPISYTMADELTLKRLIKRS